MTDAEAYDELRVQNNQRAGLLLRIAHILGDAPIRAEADLPEAVADLIAERDSLQARIDAYEGHLERWEEMRLLIKASSLGEGTTDEAFEIPTGLAHAIILGAQYLARAEDAEAAAEAAAEAVFQMGDRLATMREERDALQRLLADVCTALYPPPSGPDGVIEHTDLPNHVAMLRHERDRLQAPTAGQRTDIWHLINDLADEVGGIDGNVIRGWLDTTVREAVMGYAYDEPLRIACPDCNGEPGAVCDGCHGRGWRLNPNVVDIVGDTDG